MNTDWFLLAGLILTMLGLASVGTYPLVRLAARGNAESDPARIQALGRARSLVNLGMALLIAGALLIVLWVVT